MTFDAAFLLALIFKMGITAGLVIAASYAAERLGPLVGAMIATLPISAGPTYVFLALEHTPQFIADSALSSVVTNSATAIFALTYAVVAQRAGAVVSIAGALVVWVTVWFLLQTFAWTLPLAILQALVVFPLCLMLASSYRHAPMRPPGRRWYDLPLRAGLVAMLVAVVVTLSPLVGAGLTGMLAVSPVVLTSLMLILQPRVGGRASAAVIANAISGLAGFALSLAVLHVVAVPWGPALGFCLALTISIGWNLMVLAARRRGIPI